jgi:iron complex outermembrane receptor protein
MSVRDQIFTSAIAISAALACTPAAAQTEQRRGYQLEAQDLGTALRAVGRTSNSEIFFETNIVDGKRAPALRGQYTPREAVEALIQGTNLVILERRGAIILRERQQRSKRDYRYRIAHSMRPGYVARDHNFAPRRGTSRTDRPWSGHS